MMTTSPLDWSPVEFCGLSLRTRALMVCNFHEFTNLNKLCDIVLINYGDLSQRMRHVRV